jgi:hypothetical protein
VQNNLEKHATIISKTTITVSVNSVLKRKSKGVKTLQDLACVIVEDVILEIQKFQLYY